MARNPLEAPPGPSWGDDNPLMAGPTQADAWDATRQAYAQFQERDRQRQIALGHIDPQTGAMTPAGWRAQAQAIGGGLGDSGGVGVAGGLAGIIRGWHGSPHNFPAERLVQMPGGGQQYIKGLPDILPEIPPGANVLKDLPLGRFDMDKIGTGEGNQSYGHGPYIGGREGTARGYRDRLSGRGYDTSEGTVLSHGDAHDALVEAVNQSGTKFHPDQRRAIAGDVLDNINWSGSLDKFLRDFELPGGNWRPGYEAAVAKAAQLGLKPNKGYMYEVNLHTNPENLLDWDKPLAGQGAPVREAVTPIYPGAPDGISRLENGRWAVTSDGRPVGRADGWPDMSTAQYVMKTMREDTPSLQNMTGAQLHEYLAKNGPYGGRNPGEAANTLRDAGIPGLQYLDAGSRSAGEGSRNYVMFNPELIEIIRKYGIAGLLGSGAAGAAAGGTQSQSQ